MKKETHVVSAVSAFLVVSALTQNFNGVSASDLTEDKELKTETVYHNGEDPDRQCKSIFERGEIYFSEYPYITEERKMRPNGENKKNVLVEDWSIHKSGALMLFADQEMRNEEVINKFQKQLDKNDIVYVEKTGDISVFNYEKFEGNWTDLIDFKINDGQKIILNNDLFDSLKMACDNQGKLIFNNKNGLTKLPGKSI